MPSTPSPDHPNPPRDRVPRAIDVRDLSLPQLKRLADGGSRRARAELERRLGPPPKKMAPKPPHARAQPIQPVQTPAPAASAASPSPPQAPPHAPPPIRATSTTQPVDPADNPPSQEAVLDQLALLERQDAATQRSAGVAKFMGLILMAWGGIFAFGSLLMLLNHASKGSYYLFSGIACIVVGMLLMRLNRWAMPFHGIALAAAIAWALQVNGGNIGVALVQCIPLAIAALWVVLPSVHDALR